MSLIIDAVKTAQRERADRVGTPAPQRSLIESFFPTPPKDAEGNDFRRAILIGVSIGIAVIALALFGYVYVTKHEKSTKIVPPSVLPTQQPAGTARTEFAPGIRTAIPTKTGGASATSSRTAVAHPLSTRGVSSTPFNNEPQYSRARQSTDGAPARSKVAAATALADSPKVQTARPIVRSSAPSSNDGLRVAVTGEARSTLDPRSTDALDAQRQGNFEKAQKLYEQLLSDRKASADDYNNYGVLLLQHGDTTTAITLYRQAIALNPNKIESLLNLGEALDRRGIHAEATSIFQQALTIDPQNVRAKIQLADQYEAIGATSNAQRILTELVRAAPKDPAAHYALGRFFVAQRDVPSALAEFEKFLEFAPGTYDRQTIDSVKSYVASLKGKP